SAHWRFENTPPCVSRLLSFSFFCYSLLSSFSASKHSKHFIFVISTVPAAQRMSDGGLFMTRSDSFMIRPGAASVLEPSTRSFQFFVTLLSAIHEPCTWKATGIGFGPKLGGWAWCSLSWGSRSLLGGVFRCEREPTNVIGWPRLPQRFCSRFEGLSMFQGTKW